MWPFWVQGAGWPSGPCRLTTGSVFSFPLGVGEAPLLSFSFLIFHVVSSSHCLLCGILVVPSQLSALQPCAISSYLSSAHRPSRPTPCLCSVPEPSGPMPHQALDWRPTDIFDCLCPHRAQRLTHEPFFTLYFLSCFFTHLSGSLAGLSLSLSLCFPLFRCWIRVLSCVT